MRTEIYSLTPAKVSKLATFTWYIHRWRTTVDCHKG